MSGTLRMASLSNVTEALVAFFSQDVKLNQEMPALIVASEATIGALVVEHMTGWPPRRMRPEDQVEFNQTMAVVRRNEPGTTMLNTRIYCEPTSPDGEIRLYGPAAALKFLEDHRAKFWPYNEKPVARPRRRHKLSGRASRSPKAMI